MSLLLTGLPPAMAAADEHMFQLPVPGTWQASDQAFGRITATADTTIQLPFPLRITGAPVAPGHAVSKDEELLRFDAPQLGQELMAYADARRGARIATEQLAVLRTNTREHTATRREQLTAAREQANAQAAVNAAWDRLAADLLALGADTRRDRFDKQLEARGAASLAASLGILHAPFPGVVLNRPPPVGAWIAANNPLLELEDLRQVYVTVALPPERLSSWQDGEARILHQRVAIPLTPLSGVPGIDPASGLRRLRYVSANPGDALQDGEWVRVEHLSPPRRVLWVPVSAVVSRNGHSWCIIRKLQAMIPIRVTTGPAEDGRIPVLSGLGADQPVATVGAYELLYRDLKTLIQFNE